MEFRVEAGSKQLHFGGALVPPVRCRPMDPVMVRTLDLLPGWQLCPPPSACGVSPPASTDSVFSEPPSVLKSYSESSLSSVSGTSQ